jgi:nucleoid DNA-binding protein
MKDKMTFQFLVENCYAQYQGEKVTKKIAEEIVKSVFEDIKDAVVSGRSVTIRNFGKFTSVEKEGREYVEPQNQKRVKVGPGRYPRFIASTNYKKAVRG